LSLLVFMTERLASLPVYKVNLRAGGANDHLMIVGPHLVALIQPMLNAGACRRASENDRAIHRAMIVPSEARQLSYLKSGAARTILDAPNDPANLTNHVAGTDCDGAAPGAHNRPDGTAPSRPE
jgi:hypothetical protein